MFGMLEFMCNDLDAGVYSHNRAFVHIQSCSGNFSVADLTSERFAHSGKYKYRSVDKRVGEAGWSCGGGGGWIS